MAELKTMQTSGNVTAFLEGIKDQKMREIASVVLDLMRSVTKLEPAMWGSSIVGFGSYHYVYDSGHEGDSYLVGFSPRKAALTVYSMGGFPNHSTLMKKIGTCKTGKGCIYIKSMDDIHIPTLRQLIKESVQHLKQRYPARRSR